MQALRRRGRVPVRQLDYSVRKVQAVRMPHRVEPRPGEARRSLECVLRAHVPHRSARNVALLLTMPRVHYRRMVGRNKPSSHAVLPIVRREGGERMIPTNEERRRVAERLRSIRSAPEWATTACCIADCIGEGDYPLWDGSKPLFDRLADLIAPEPERTCQLVRDDDSIDELYPAYDYVCSACGGVCCGQCGYRYCPNCGAKAVER